MIRWLDVEACHRFELLDDDNIQLREDFAGTLQQEDQHLSGQQAKIQEHAESLFKLEVQVGCMTFERQIHLEAEHAELVQKQSAPGTSGNCYQV